MLRKYEIYEDDIAVYRNLRQALAPEYAGLPADELDILIEDSFPYTTADALDRDLGRFFSRAGKELGKAAPGMLQGAMSGAAAGSALGPYGMLAGALGGAALGGFQSHQAATQRERMAARAQTMSASPAGAAAAPPQNLSAMRPGAPGATAGTAMAQPSTGVTAPMGANPMPMAGAGGNASAQLLALLSRPEILQALASMAMGQLGRRDVRVGESVVPVGAVGNLISVLGQRSAAQHNPYINADAAEIPDYLIDETGEFVCDPMDAEQRAYSLLNLVARSNPRLWPASLDDPDDDNDWIDDDDDIDELLDSIEEDEIWAEELEELFG